MQKINWKTILGVIQREVPNLIDIEAQKERLKDLIHHKALRTATSEWLCWIEKKITVENGIAQLPCDLVRLLKVFDDKMCEIQVNRDNTAYLKAPCLKGCLYIHYYGIPMMEEDGEEVPSLIYEFSDYYAWSVIKSVLQEKWIEGKIGDSKWAWIERQEDLHFDAAISNTNLYSITDLEEQVWLMQNGIYL